MTLIYKILDVLFPRRCPICHEIVDKRGEIVCPECRKKPAYVKEPYCIKCGKQLKNPEKVYCSGCEGGNVPFEEGRAVFIYDDIMRKSIYRFKYNSRKEYARFYAEEMFKKYGNKIRIWNPDIIIPIPLHKSKQRTRGYNQAYLIAKELSYLTKIPVKDNILIREKRTEKQKKLGSKARRNNLKSAFKMRPNGVQYSSAMLIDDIYTTGATMMSATDALKCGGINQIYVLSLSIGVDIQEDLL